MIPEFGRALIESTERFVIHSGRGKGEDTLLVSDFVDKYNLISPHPDQSSDGLLIFSTHAHRRACRPGIDRMVDMLPYAKCHSDSNFYEFANGCKLVTEIVEFGGPPLPRRLRGRQYGWIGIYGINSYDDQFISSLGLILDGGDSATIRGMADPDSMPYGTWVQVAK